MARLNTRNSATPLPTRSSTVDSLYRDPSLAPRHDSNVRASPYSVLSPTQSISSDKENAFPETRENTPKATKAKGLRGAVARMPTPDSGSAPGSHGNKRRRTGDYTMSESEIFQDDPEEEGEGVEQDDEDNSDLDQSQAQAEAEEEGDLRFYNPNQDPDQRRRLRARMRGHQRNVDDNRDEMVKANTKLLDALKMQNNLFGKVRQTADAALDSRFLVNASELAGKKLNNSLQGNAGIGIDLDQFVSKCIYFMKTGGHNASEKDAPAMPVAEEEEEDGDGLDWALLGRQACFPSNKRPATSSFLLGPLSVQKRARLTQRRARSQRLPVGPATRPQEIREGDIQQSDKSNLSNIVKSINARLKSHIEKADTKIAEELSEIEDEVGDEDLITASRRNRAAVAPTQELAVNLLDFAINPHDFGQTVENLFYISFLVREGAASIMKDDEGLPLLMPAKAQDIQKQRENNAQKNQAIFSLDYSTWQMFIEAFNIKEPLIPHREPEEANVGSGGWYAG